MINIIKLLTAALDDTTKERDALKLKVEALKSQAQKSEEDWFQCWSDCDYVPDGMPFPEFLCLARDIERFVYE